MSLDQTLVSKERRHKRHPTILAVRFLQATDFVTEYAENLSAGGLFVRRAHELEPLSDVEVRLELAGYGSFSVKARVAHVLGEEMAKKMGRSPGAGLQLTKVPPGFDDALRGYLERLGRRRDFLILAEDAACVEMLASAGFHTSLARLALLVEQTLGASTVLAVVTTRTSTAAFRAALAASPKQVPVIGCDHVSDEEPLLAELDRLVSTS